MANKRIMITGASDGIGKALANEMAARSYDLALCARSQDKLEALQGDLKAAHPSSKVEIAALDVQQTDTVEAVVSGLAEKLGGLDIVVANAGIAYAGKLGKSPLDQHLNVINTNVNGAIATLDAGLKVFRKQGYGHLVAISSVAASRGFPRNAAYCGSKAALSTIMESLRAETYSENIDVTVLNPGYIDTELNRSIANRPFLINVEKGATIMAELIERKVSRSTVPVYPWKLLTPILKRLPTKIIAGM